MNVLENLPKPFFILAPMDDVTDTAFRQVVSSLAKPDLFFSEFVNVDGLQSPGRPRLLKKLRFTETDTPLMAQLWGKNPENFYKTAKEIANGKMAAEFGITNSVNYAGVDLNMGCPQKTEVNGGTCSALINNRPLAHEIIEATKEGLGGKLPISVKTRTGYTEIDLTWVEFLLTHNLNMLTLHGRTKKDMSKVPANWDVIGEARKIRDRESPNTLFVGNGDVMSKEQGIELTNQYGLDGIMIGRGIFQDPYAFSTKDSWSESSPIDKVRLYKKHVSLHAQTWQYNERPIHVLNKFCKIYINDFEGAKDIRETLMHATSHKELSNLLDKLESQLKSQTLVV